MILPRSDRHLERRGVVLFVITIVIALVSLSAYGFAVLMQTEYRATQLRGDQIQTEQVAASGVDYLRAILSHSRSQRTEWGGWQDNAPLFRDQIVDFDLQLARTGRFSIVSPYHAAEDAPPQYQFGVEDTSSKLSLEALLRWDQQTPGSARQALLQLPGMDDSLADALLDWIDPDDEEREFGAESEYYLELEPSRQPANTLPTILDQLLAVRGFTSGQLLGLEPYQSQETVDSDGTDTGTRIPIPSPPVTSPADSLGTTSWSGASATGMSQVPWSRYLTVYSAERNETWEGEPRINLNSADLSELHQQLTELFDESIANFVIALRRYGPTSSTTGNLQTGPAPLVAFQEQASFTFTSPLDIIDAYVAIPNEPRPDASDDSSEPQTTTYASPFSTQQGSLREELVAFCDGTTTSSDERFFGRINIQQAPREVLLGIPGISAETVDQLLSSRETGSRDTESQIHPVWLLVEGIVDLPTMKQLLPWLNTGGDVIRAEIIAYYEHDSPWTRQETMLDGTRKGTPAIYYRDLRRMGRGFRWEQLARESSSPDSATSPPPTEDLPGPYSISQPTSESTPFP